MSSITPTTTCSVLGKNATGTKKTAAPKMQLNQEKKYVLYNILQKSQTLIIYNKREEVD